MCNQITVDRFQEYRQAERFKEFWRDVIVSIVIKRMHDATRQALSYFFA